MTMQTLDSTNRFKVRLLDGDDGQEIWRGTLREFYDANTLTDEEMDEIEATLAAGEPWHCGGGAAAAYTLIGAADAA